MLSVKRFVMQSGERFAVLTDSVEGPMSYPSLYSVIYLRNRGLSVNTIVAVLGDIKLLYLLSAKLDINLEQRVKNKEFLNLREIESIAHLASFKRAYLFKRKPKVKIISFPLKSRKEAARAKIKLQDNSVSKGLVSRRVDNFSDYIEWLESYFHPSVKTSTRKAFKSRRPKQAMDIAMYYKSFDEQQLDIILNLIDPKNKKCIWTTDFLNYRNELIIYLFLYLGCRKGELLNLKESDIVHSSDEFKGVKLNDRLKKIEGTTYITIRRNHDDKDDPRLYQPLVKTRSRTLAINLKLKQKLDDYRLKYRSLIPNSELTDFLILSDEGKPLSINALNKIFTQISDEASFRVHAHAFRHTWNDKYTDKVSILIAAGKTTEAKAENDRAYLMGWVPGSQSARRYSMRAEAQRAMKVGLEIQEKFEDKIEEFSSSK